MEIADKISLIMAYIGNLVLTLLLIGGVRWMMDGKYLVKRGEIKDEWRTFIN